MSPRRNSHTIKIGKTLDILDILDRETKQKGNSPKSRKKKGDVLLPYETIKIWLKRRKEQASSRNKQFTAKIQRDITRMLLRFVKFANMNPDALIELAHNDIEEVMALLIGFMDSLKAEGLKHNSARFIRSNAQGFFTLNDIVFPKRFKIPPPIESAVHELDSKTTIFTVDEDTGEIQMANGLLQQFVQNLNFRDQAICAGLISTAQDSEDLTSLNISFVKDAKGNLSNVSRFFLEGNRKKTGEPFKVYFSKEATEFIRRYVEQERAGAGDNDPLFIGKDEKRLTAQRISKNFRETALKLGIISTKKQNPFRPKRFRRIFRTACTNQQIDEAIRRTFMGHSKGVHGSYFVTSPQILLQAYLKIEPYITLFGVDKSRLNSMGEEIADLQEAKQQLYEDLHKTGKERDTLKERIGRLEKRIEGMTQRFDKLGSLSEKQFQKLLKLLE